MAAEHFMVRRGLAACGATVGNATTDELAVTCPECLAADIFTPRRPRRPQPATPDV